MTTTRERGFACRALTRDPGKPEARNFVGHGVEAFQGNMDDQASLTRAVDGVDGVFGVTTPYEGGVEAEVRQGINLADAAKRSRSSHFVYTSVGSADQQTGIPHFDSKFRIEQHLRGKGDVAFLEHAFNKLMLNFTWWVNRKDPDRKSVV